MKSLPESLLSNPSSLTACPDCDLLMTKKRPAFGQKTECPRCGCVLERYKRNTVSRSLALGLAGLFIYFPAVFMPLMTFQKLGLRESGNVFETIITFYTKGYYFVAIMILFSAAIFPLIKLTLLITVTTFLKTNRRPKFLAKIFRWYQHLDEWAMVEVYLLGIMVTVVKMYHSTDIVYNAGFFCFIGLVLLTIASSVTVSRVQFWDLIENKSNDQGSDTTAEQKINPVELPVTTAMQNGCILCLECSKLISIRDLDETNTLICSRCGASLHQRKPASIVTTWALILTAAIFYFPANLLPIMRVEFLGIPSYSTIIDGIRLFFQQGSYGIAIIILTASILIPLLKILGLALVLITAQLKRPFFIRQKASMFRFIEFVGKWSMLDIFVIALLGAFVNFGFLTSIETAPAATYFCIVVVTTMIAALTFDPRLIWDIVDNEVQDSAPCE